MDKNELKDLAKYCNDKALQLYKQKVNDVIKDDLDIKKFSEHHLLKYSRIAAFELNELDDSKKIVSYLNTIYNSDPIPDIKMFYLIQMNHFLGMDKKGDGLFSKFQKVAERKSEKDSSSYYWFEYFNQYVGELERLTNIDEDFKEEFEMANQSRYFSEIGTSSSYSLVNVHDSRIEKKILNIKNRIYDYKLSDDQIISGDIIYQLMDKIKNVKIKLETVSDHVPFQMKMQFERDYRKTIEEFVLYRNIMICQMFDNRILELPLIEFQQKPEFKMMRKPLYRFE